MSEEAIITILPREDGSGVDVELAGEISAKPLIIGVVTAAARVCGFTGLSVDEFLTLLREAMKIGGGEE